ncbi:MAG TPA: glycosyltransferase family 87 protein [Sphingomicrobium sp.]|nr:glycosyltransferase family 87 protein [Sphingomicrobium sp.]
MQSLVRWAGVSACLTISLWFIVPLVLAWSVLPDFTIFWAAAKFALTEPRKIYNITAMGAAQSWAIAPSKGPRPFPYPPTALLLIAPFGFLPFWAAYWSWTVLSIGAFWSAVRRVAYGWAVPLSVAMPHSVLVLILGQTTLFASSAAIWAISLLRTRAVFAGMLFGLAAALKPQSVLLAPIVFIRLRDWRIVAGAAFSFAVLFVVSLVFGAELWPSWLTTLAAHPQMVSHYHLEIVGATPRMAAIGIHLAEPAIFVVQLLGIAAGVAVVWVGFGSIVTLVRLQCFATGCLLASPYAMRYEVAAIAPVLAVALLRAEPRSILVSLPTFAFNAVFVVASLVVSSVTSLIDDRKRDQPQNTDAGPSARCEPATASTR